MNPPKYSNLPARFWDKVEVQSSGCWEWIASINSNGYGSFGVAGKIVVVHQISARDAKGDPSAGMQTLHHCDVRSCVNPEHLYFGTNQDNINDKVRRGRASRLPGERNGRARLTEQNVLLARKMRSSGKYSYPAIAKEFGVPTATIYSAVTGQSWTYLGDVN